MILTMAQHNSKVDRIKSMMRECRELSVELNITSMLEHRCNDSWANRVITFVDKHMGD